MVSDQLQNRLRILLELDTAQISEIVRREQASPGFEIGSWDVRQLSSGGGINPEGLFLSLAGTAATSVGSDHGRLY